MLEWAWLIPLVPLVGTLINGLFGRWVPRALVGPIACSVVGVSFYIALNCFLELTGMPADARVFSKDIFTWIQAGSLNVAFGVMIDPLSSVMILVVTGVGFLIHVYSIGYMSHDRDYSRYFSYLNLFTASMLILVTANSIILLFVGWELVGLCSYLLIGFWYEKKSASDAGKKAFIVNRVGDFGFILGAMALFSIFGSLNFSDIFGAIHHNATVTPWFADRAMPVQEALHAVTPLFGLPLVTVIALSLFLGATGKSAQIPLYVWLPDAMEGPTPVSALIHAATMVTAGVYMVARCSALFTLSSTAMLIIAFTGALTALFAASIGLVQNDIKRVLAYSTVSQLGYMFLALGVGAFAAGIFHLVTHAFFKALLFMCAGSVMHALHGELDMKKMGGLGKIMKITAPTMWIGSLAIAGIPFFSGFFSKDEILWSAFIAQTGCSAVTGKVLWAMGAAAALMTAFYMFRLIFMTFHGKSRLDHHVHPHESPPSMTFPLIVLAVLAAVAGFAGAPKLLSGLPFASHWFFDWLAPMFPAHGVAAAAHGAEAAAHGAEAAHETTMEMLIMGASVAIALVGIFTAYVMYLAKPDLHDKVRQKLAFIHAILFNKYYVDEIYTWLIVEPGKWFSTFFLWKFFDAGIIDGIVNGAAWVVNGVGSIVRRLQTGVVLNYALYLVLGIIVILYYVLRAV